jgi:molybdopterin-synthase adenylyltransferase
MTLSDEQLDRYARHIVLRDIGGAGQAKLLASHVALIGAGGIGCPAIQYLTAAGVGTITVIDDDKVSLSNLQRQILYDETQIDTPKVEAARLATARLNPGVTFHAVQQRITKETSAAILNGVDAVIASPAGQRGYRAVSWSDRHLYRVATRRALLSVLCRRRARSGGVR